MSFSFSTMLEIVLPLIVFPYFAAEFSDRTASEPPPLFLRSAILEEDVLCGLVIIHVCEARVRDYFHAAVA